ncbi:MAG: DoxX family membrane protein [Acidobacteriaceae bacterium]|nr:DoxX family membrane protein [Acidobacteriaceae bacterium]
METAIATVPGAQPTHEQRLAYTLLRLFAGLDYFGHGYVRIFTGKFLPGFANGLQQAMSTAPLDPNLVYTLGFVIPVVELVVGSLLLLGIFTRWTLFAAYSLMFLLLFGTTMKQDWTAASEQLLYALVLSLLLVGREKYNLSWAAIFRRQR